jgi:hypothetical protein
MLEAHLESTSSTFDHLIRAILEASMITACAQAPAPAVLRRILHSLNYLLHFLEQGPRQGTLEFIGWNDNITLCTLTSSPTFVPRGLQ